MICEFCGKECKNINSLKNHEIRCKFNPNRIISFMNGLKAMHERRKLYGGINQFTKAKLEGRTFEVSEETRQKISKSNTGKKWDDERKAEHSKRMKRAVLDHPDSYSASNVCGRVKNYEFNGMVFKGTWELKVAKCLYKNNILYTNKIDPISYTWEGKNHLYFPDFYLPEMNMYIEVKGYKRPRDLAKWKVLDNLFIMERNEIDNIDSVIEGLLNKR